MMEGRKYITKTNTGLVVDRISDLPDSILGVILSFLPSKEVVASSVLSKRWEFVWVTLHNLDFCHVGRDSEQDEGENTKLIQYVNRVFHLNDEKINRFRLLWHPYIPSHVSSWIDIAITRDVRRLSLCLGKFDVPISVFTCVSLQSLNLTRTDIYISDALAVCLLRLEILKLDSACFQSEEAFEKLIKGCPMLHSLHINVFFVTRVSYSCKISSTTLRRLEIRFGYNISLMLKAPALEYLKITGELFVEGSLRSLVHADFHITSKKNYLSNKAVVKAVGAFEFAKTLTLSAHAMQALSVSGLSLSTAFERLVTLEIEIFEFVSSFRDFLLCSAKLEVLIIHQLSLWDDRSEWIAPLKVPVCLSFSLKKVQFDHFKGSEGELEMIRYMLKNGSVLGVVHISYDCRKAGEQSKLLQKIREFPKKSPTCEVRFSVRPSREFKTL